MKHWEKYKFKDLLHRVERFELRVPHVFYRFAGTYSFGKGIFLSKERKGEDFKLSTIQRIKTGDFIYCKIMAWEGAFGIAPPEVDNCVMSGAFVVYEINEQIIIPDYLGFYFKSEKIWKEIGGKSEGTNLRRRSLSPEQFESATMLVPNREEQTIIIQKLRKFDLLKMEVVKMEETLNALIPSVLDKAFKGEL